MSASKHAKPLFPRREEGKSVGKLSLPSITPKAEEMAHNNAQYRNS